MNPNFELQQKLNSYKFLLKKLQSPFSIWLLSEKKTEIDVQLIETSPDFEKLLNVQLTKGEWLTNLLPLESVLWLEKIKQLSTSAPAENEVTIKKHLDGFQIHFTLLEENIVLIWQAKTNETALGSFQENALKSYLTQLSEMIRSIANPLDIQQKVSDLLGKRLNVDRVVYKTIVEDDGVPYFEVNRVYHAPRAPFDVGRYPMHLFGEMVTQQRAGFETVVDDLENFDVPPSEMEVYQSIQMQAFIMVPIIKEDKYVAALSVHHTESRKWSNEDVLLVRETAERTWDAVVRAMAEEAYRNQIELQERNEQLRQDAQTFKTHRQQEILKASLNAQEEERKRLAENIHEGLGQVLFGVKTTLDKIGNETELSEMPKQLLQNAIKLLDVSIKESRKLSHQLMPTVLEDFGLKVALEDICRLFEGPVNFHYRFVGLEEPLANYLQTAVYRITQELAGNVINHADATICKLNVTRTQTNLRIEIEDNGKGFDAHNHKNWGIGLRSIETKVKLLNGEIHMNSTPTENGTSIKIRFPIPV